MSYLYHHFYLKPTWCAKGAVESNSEACAFRNDRVRQKHSTLGKIQRAHFILVCVFMTWQPLMDCAICYKTANNVMEANPKPYVHCIQKPRLTPVFVRSSFTCECHDKNPLMPPTTTTSPIPSCLLSHRRSWGAVGQNIAEKWATTAELQHFWLWNSAEGTRGATHCMIPKQLTFCTTNRCPPAIISYIKDPQIIWRLVMF